MKRLCIVGRGTVGCLSAAHFLRHTDWEIQWRYDPGVPAAAVGEGTTAVTPRALSDTLGWTWTDIADMDGTVKTGIYKDGWGLNSGEPFTHAFPAGTTGMHFNAVQFQAKAFAQIEHAARVTVQEGTYTNADEIDADHVLVCTGSPKEGEFVAQPEIPVNTAYVTQCYWDGPRFTHTLTLARPWGWVFGIPLRNRCSIGYLYNNTITPLEVVKEDVQTVFAQFGLEPSTDTNHIHFRNYARTENYTDRVAYNGNASFFLEPLEATSTTMADNFTRYAYDVWTGMAPAHAYNVLYHHDIENVKAMICLHYLAGSSRYDTLFWTKARASAVPLLRRIFSDENHPFRINALRAMDKDWDFNCRDVGTWGRHSYEFNIQKLGIGPALRQMAS
jgi:hypothetical protein